jgi:hypothetical protein
VQGNKLIQRAAGRGFVTGSQKENCARSSLLSVSIKAGTRLKDIYLVAGAAALAVLEEGLVAARCHRRERRQVHVLESTGTTCTRMRNKLIID